jgi:hypothetical protein
MLLKVSTTNKRLKGWMPSYDRNFRIIRTTIMPERMSMNPAVCEMPGTIDLPKKLSSQYTVRTRMIKESKGISF